MKNVLVTGATGQVGFETILSLMAFSADLNIVAAVRNVANDAKKFTDMPVKVVAFDFEKCADFETLFETINILFLLRPPQISDVQKVFTPIISAAKHSKIEHIVFLSVQGVDKNSIIPHHKIEKLIALSGIPYTFVRPAYFMQNFTSTLLKDIIVNREIYLPAGKAQFSIIDLKDLGLVIAHVLINPRSFVNQSFDVTNRELKTFKEMAEEFSQILGYTIQYRSPNLISFYLRKRREGMASVFILVMIMLHYFPRFQKPPVLTNQVFLITGKEPFAFIDFIKREKEIWLKSTDK